MKRKAQVKVSGMVPTETHAQMTVIAQQERTTIGAIVQWAVRLALGELARNPEAAKSLEPDARPDANRARKPWAHRRKKPAETRVKSTR